MPCLARCCIFKAWTGTRMSKCSHCPPPKLFPCSQWPNKVNLMIMKWLIQANGLGFNFHASKFFLFPFQYSFIGSKVEWLIFLLELSFVVVVAYLYHKIILILYSFFVYLLQSASTLSPSLRMLSFVERKEHFYSKAKTCSSWVTAGIQAEFPSSAEI